MKKTIAGVVLLLLCQSFAANAAEHWTEIGTHRFGIIRSLFRSQGIANDGEGHFWFSSAVSLLRTDSVFGGAVNFHFFPLPLELDFKGDNHIGDLDYFDGKLVIGIEDGSKYRHPYLGVADAETLDVERYKPVPHDWQPDGVPWAAIEPSTQRVFSAQYSNTTKINVYDYATLDPVTQIPMSKRLNAIQGAKVFEGSLYMTADDVDSGHGHALYKMELSTGEVSQVGRMDDDVSEVEGLTFVPQADGAHIYVLTVVGHGFGRRVKLCDFKKDEI